MQHLLVLTQTLLQQPHHIRHLSDGISKCRPLQAGSLHQQGKGALGMQPVEWCPPPSPSKRRLHSRPQCCNFSSPGSLHEDTHCGTRAESRYRCRGWSSPAPSVCSKELTPHATRPVLLTRKGKNGMNWVRTTNTSTVAGRKLPTWFQV